MKSEYEILIETARTLEVAQRAIPREGDVFNTPAWVMVHHAKQHVLELATSVLRGAA